MVVFSVLCQLVILNLTFCSNITTSSINERKRRDVVTRSESSKQHIECYENTDLSGDVLKAIDYVPSLSGYSFNDRVQSCCVTGIWILYADENYNAKNSEGSSWYVYGDNYCSKVPTAFLNVASSLRFTGAPDGMQYDTLNFYHLTNFMGSEEFTYHTSAQLSYPDSVRSIVITGCSSWTLYTEVGYKGRSVCISNGGTSASCNPGFYPFWSLNNNAHRRIGSVKKGCFSSSQILPDEKMNIFPKK